MVRHRLAASTRTDDIAAVAESVVALHSSDPASVYLSAFARMANPSVDAVSHALYEARSVVRHHAMRRTVWVFTPEVGRWAHAACTEAIAAKEWNQLRAWVARSGIDEPGAWLDGVTTQVLAALHERGPLSARQLGREVPELTRKIVIGTGNYTGEASAHTRVLQNLGFDARIVRTTPTGTWLSSEYQWQVMGDWLLDGLSGLDPADARTHLVRCYLDRFGPVTLDDVRWWTGLTAAASNAALRTLDAVEVDLDDGRTGWVLPDDVPSTDGDIGEFGDDVVLLPSLDPTAMGWKHRSWYLGEHTTFPSALFDRNGNIGPTVWHAGRMIGGWGQRADGTVVYELLTAPPRGIKGAAGRAAERLTQLLDGTRVTLRFPTPLWQSLST